jgi:hypothetical protein
MGTFEYRQAEEIRDAFARHGVRYLFIGKSGAILLGFPDTTQDADLFVEKSPDNGRAIVAALRELGFALDDEQAAQIECGKDFVQLKNGPFDLDLVFAPGWTISTLFSNLLARRRSLSSRRPRSGRRANGPDMKKLEVRLRREPGQERIVGQLAEIETRPAGGLT